MGYLSYIKIFVIIFTFSFKLVEAQIAVTNFPPMDNEEYLVNEVFLGGGITTSNYSSVGFTQGIGFFDGFNSNIGFDEGVVLSTGGLEFVSEGFGVGSAISGDPDLELALNAINLFWGVNNVTILEFDFIAESESMAFNYVFGSSEYSNYTCTQYNDIFGFFLSGPGITGPYSNNGVNLAYIPDPANPGEYTNTPVAVNTVNSGSPTGGGTAETCDNIDPNWQDYSIYWINNSNQETVQGINGFTVPFIAEYNDLICGETYHIKLAIADASDGALNSAVFLEANSFSSPDVQISTVPNTELGLVLDIENGVLEGCGEAAIQFDRGGDMSMDLSVTISYSGTAEYGVDYAELPTELVLPAFENQIIMPIDVFFDSFNEGEESLIITVSGVPVPCEDEATEQDIELIILDQQDLLLDIPNEIIIECLGSADIEAFVSGGYPPYTYTWYDNSGILIEEGELLTSGNLVINQSPEETTSYSLVITDDCLDQEVLGSTNIIVEDQTLNVVLEENLLICEEDLINISIDPDIVGGLPPYTYAWFYEGVLISNEEVLSSISGAGLYQFIVEESCGVISGDEISISIVTPAPYVELISYDVLDPTLLPEGCFESILQFNVPVIQDEDINLDFYVEGSAEFGVDYNIESTSITIPAGAESFFVPISIIVDNENEGVETIEFNFPFIDVCSGWPTQLNVQIYEPPALFIDLEDELILCLDEVETGVLDGFVNGGIGLVNYGWYYQGEMISVDMDLETNNLETGIYSFIAVDQCNNTVSEDINFDIDPAPYVELISYDVTDASVLPEACFESILEFSLPETQDEDINLSFYTEGSATIGLDYILESTSITIPAGEESVLLPITIIVDDLDEGTELIEFNFPFIGACSESASQIEITIFEPPPIYVELDDQLVLCQDDIDSGNLEGFFDGGIGSVTYGWYFEEQMISSDIDLETDNLNTGVYSFTAIDECNNIASADINFEIIEPSPYVELISYDVSDPTSLPEGCFESILQFSVPEIHDQNLNLDFYVAGSADLGLDYIIESTSVIIPAGEESVSLPIMIIVDNIDEGTETIEFNFPFINSCSEWPTQLSLDIYDIVSISVDVDEDLIICEEDLDTGSFGGSTQGGIGLVNYGWYYQDELISTNISLETSNLDEGIYSFVAVDECDNIASADLNFEIIEITPTVTLSSLDYENPSILSEGCGYSTLTFDIPYPHTESQIFNYNIIGSSTLSNGDDVELIYNYVEFLPGVTSVDVDIIPILDDIEESVETILFTFPFSTECISQSDIEVSIINYYPVEITLPMPQDLCAGQSLELQAEYTGGLPPYDVSWTYLDQNEDSQSILINVEGGFSSAIFTVIDACGRTTTEVLDMEAIDAGILNVAWPASEAFACVGDNSEINLVVQGGFPPYTYEWYLDGFPIPPTLYNGIEEDPQIFADADQLIQTMPPYTPYTYNYQVFITDSCSNQLEYNIEVMVDDCMLPTTFTPNNDGNNDIFWVNFGDLVGKVGLEIFNRWGSVVYQSEDYSPCVKFKSECWDGTHFQNFGDLCSEGVYYYVFTYSRPIKNMDSYDVSGFEEAVAGGPHNRSLGLTRTGNILLLR